MIEWVNGKLSELAGTIQLGGFVLAIAIVALAYAKTRTLVAVLVAVLTAGVFLWAINNTDWFRDRVGDETEGAHRVVTEHAVGVAVLEDPVVVGTHGDGAAG